MVNCRGPWRILAATIVVSDSPKRSEGFPVLDRFPLVERQSVYWIRVDRSANPKFLAHFFGTSAEFWLNLQKLYELRLAEKKAGKAIKALPTLKNEHVHA